MIFYSSVLAKCKFMYYLIVNVFLMFLIVIIDVYTIYDHFVLRFDHFGKAPNKYLILLLLWYQIKSVNGRPMGPRFIVITLLVL